jgi:pyruvate dehydrogenase E1 component beta subunit
MAKNLLISACLDPNPVIFLEPRWLYQTVGPVSQEFNPTALDKSRVVKTGSDITLVAYGDGLVASIQAVQILKQNEISVEVLDLVSINPIDYLGVMSSVEKTGRLLTVDTTNAAFSVGREIIGSLVQNSELSCEIYSIACPNVPIPTAPSLTSIYYPNKISIANKILNIFNKREINLEMTFEELHLAPKFEFEFE